MPVGTRVVEQGNLYLTFSRSNKMTTKFSPANSEGEVTLITRAGKKARYNAEHDVTNVDFPVSRSWRAQSGEGYDQKTSWWQAAAWTQSAQRAAEVEKGDIIIVNFHLADVTAEAFQREDGSLGASMKIERCRVRVIHGNGEENSFEASASQMQAEPEPDVVPL
jgi:single-stranded DNA-binding protein